MNELTYAEKCANLDAEAKSGLVRAWTEARTVQTDWHQHKAEVTNCTVTENGKLDIQIREAGKKRGVRIDVLIDISLLPMALDAFITDVRERQEKERENEEF